MRCRWLIGILLTVCLIPGVLNAQDSAKVEVERQLEEAFEEFDPDDPGLNGEQLTQFLEDLAANPVNINAAEFNDLLQVPGINLLIAGAIIEYRESQPFEQLSDLKRVRGIGEQTFRRMQPYLTIGNARERFRDLYTNPEYWLAGNQLEYISRFQQNLEEQEGFRRPDSLGGYVGSPVKYYQRLRMQSRHFSLNLTQEKDAGETLSGPTDFDFNSIHFALTDNGDLQQLVIGDYSLSFGQGLVLWTGGAFGKGREVTGTINKNERGLRPYGSAQETDFFRGIAATYGQKLIVTAFYSDRARTASALEGDTVRYPSSAGFHRTLSELDRRNNIDQQTIGGNLKANTSLGLFGVTGYTVQFSQPIGSSASPADRYDFTGTQHSVIGADYRGLIGNVLVFGEAARSQNGGFGAIAGAEAALGSDTEWSLAYRNYAKDFQSFLGTGFGEASGDPQNEKGLYFALKHRLLGDYYLSAYVDQYRFEAPRTGSTQPTAGYDVLGLLEGRITRELSAYILIRNEIKDEEYTIIDHFGRQQVQVGEEQRSSIRLHTEYQLNRQIRLRSRVEFVRYRAPGEESENGMLIYQDLRLRLRNNLLLDGRVTIFDTDSFDTRVYQFENDLLYVLSNTVLSGRGERMYAVLKYEPTDFLEIWAKYSVSLFEDVQTLSSGLGQIEGNRRSFLGVQVRIRI